MIIRYITQSIHFLGGIWFALLLIFLVALLAAIGTWYPDIYESLFFQILLAGFFVNILVSALRRYPFKKRHTGFLITHLGLLLIIFALFVKASWGLSATLPLDKGAASSTAYKPEKLVIQIQDRAKKSLYFPANRPFTMGSTHFDPGPLLPHAKVNLRLAHDGQKACLLGIGTIPFFENMTDSEPLKTGPWHIFALSKPNSLTPHTIAIYDKEIHVCSNQSTSVYSLALDSNPLYAFDEGFNGYGICLPLPDGRALYAPLLIAIEESLEGERGLHLSARGTTIALHEAAPPQALADYLVKLMPQPVPLPFTLTLNKTWKEGDFVFATITINNEEHTLSSQQGSSYQDFRLFLSFFDSDHISLIVSKEPFGYNLLYVGIGLISLGVILLLGFRK